MTPDCNFLKLPKHRAALVIGARGGVGQAICQLWSELDPTLHIYAGSRDQSWCEIKPANSKITRIHLDICQEASLSRVADLIKSSGENLSVVFNCSGILHSQEFGPERALRELSINTMTEVFGVNTLGVGLLLKHFIPLFPRDERTIFASCSARVGSIGDNRLGGWYSYRASKAAQNMLIRTAAIEIKRLRRECVCVALHPGTVVSELSAPFTKRKDPSKLFTPEQSATKLTHVLQELSSEDSGNFFAYDASRIEW